MIDHTGLQVSDPAKSRKFYDQALAPLGYGVLMEVPVEHTGGIVRYHAPEREVEAKNPEKEIRLKIGSREALVNSAVVLMDREAFLDSGRTMVPVKFMTEALDMKAEYDLKSGAIYLIKK